MRRMTSVRTSAQSGFLRRSAGFCVALCCFCAAPKAWGQESREYEIKAAYLYNFGRYVEYPAASFADAKAPFVVSVIGPANIDGFLAAAARTKTLQNRPIVFRRHDKVADIAPCHILFVSEKLDDAIEAQINAKFADSPVVLVGEGEGAISRGSTVSFVVVENKVRLKISKKGSSRAGLKFSSKLLQIGDLED
jgi:hypothetical protein